VGRRGGRPQGMPGPGFPGLDLAGERATRCGKLRSNVRSPRARIAEAPGRAERAGRGREAARSFGAPLPAARGLHAARRAFRAVKAHQKWGMECLTRSAEHGQTRVDLISICSGVPSPGRWRRGRRAPARAAAAVQQPVTLGDLGGGRGCRRAGLFSQPRRARPSGGRNSRWMRRGGARPRSGARPAAGPWRGAISATRGAARRGARPGRELATPGQAAAAAAAARFARGQRARHQKSAPAPAPAPPRHACLALPRPAEPSGGACPRAAAGPTGRPHKPARHRRSRPLTAVLTAPGSCPKPGAPPRRRHKLFL
jgi:hypothetical protein